ncbi:hypothetical protein N8000_05870 [Rhodospirillales bacterium]|nr:hypothetical protein [Rhodospirillales bacterium]
MSDLSIEEIKTHVINALAPFLKRADITSDTLDHDEDLYQKRIFDSLELVEIYAEIEQICHLAPAFDKLPDDTVFTSVNGMTLALNADQ